MGVLTSLFLAGNPVRLQARPSFSRFAADSLPHGLHFGLTSLASVFSNIRKSGFGVWGAAPGKE